MTRQAKPYLSHKRPVSARAPDIARMEEAQALARLKNTRAKPHYLPAKPLNRSLRTLITRLLPKGQRFSASVETLRYKWAEIVGPRLAPICHPMKITRSKGRSLLHIQADSAAATMLTHMGPLLLERIQAAGANSLDDIRIHHTGSQAGVSKTARIKPDTSCATNPEQLKTLASSLEKVKNGTVRDALVKLAKALS